MIRKTLLLTSILALCIFGLAGCKKETPSGGSTNTTNTTGDEGTAAPSGTNEMDIE
ncbi:MAG: hypothetical protein ACR2GY_00670 [Phycisphaerales bacterium]